MSDLTITERKKLERLFGMSSGFVLKYSDRTFAEFVLESTALNINDERYCSDGRSKAKRLRRFWKLEDNRTVGKLLNDLINDIDEPAADIEICRLIANRLLGHTSETSDSHRAANVDHHQPARRDIPRRLAELKDEFLNLAAETDRNKAGLKFESFLNRLFDLFELKPHKPFKLIGEQIDGSFDLDHEIYLLELKWENHRLSEAPLLTFRGKIEGKATFTRGVFVAVNGITTGAQDSITRGKQASFFVVDGHDLLMILSEAMSLPEFLRRRVRFLAQEGRVCMPFFELTERD